MYVDGELAGDHTGGYASVPIMEAL
jgi:hypothetical protein